MTTEPDEVQDDMQDSQNAFCPSALSLQFSKHFREGVRENTVEAHVGNDHLPVFRIQSNSHRSLHSDFGPLDFPMERRVPVIVDVPDSKKCSLRFHFSLSGRS